MLSEAVTEKAAGAPAGLVALTVMVLTLLIVGGVESGGTNRPPSLRPYPPQTIISLPVHTAVDSTRAAGAPVVLTVVHVSPAGL